MSTPASRTGEETTIRAIVFREEDIYIAQCLEYDICVQGQSITSLLDRLDLTVEAEFTTCKLAGRHPREMICQAPNYYHSLWEQRSVQLRRVSIPAPTEGQIDGTVICELDVAMTEAPRAAA